MAKAVTTKEQTGPQTTSQSNSGQGITTLMGYATGVQQLGARPDKPTFATYRKMRQNPTIALARMVATAPIRTAEWTLEADDGVPAAAVEFIQTNLNALWHNLVNDSLLALDYGYAPGELIFEASEGDVCVQRVKPLLVDKTEIIVDENGNFDGLKNDANGKAQVVLDASECFLYSYDCEAGNLYGRSRHENIRVNAWAEWCDIQTKRRKYFQKAAGAIPMVHYPDGEGRDEGGAVIPNWRTAKKIVAHLLNGDGIMMPTILKPWAAELARDGKAGPDMEAWSIDFLETKALHGAELNDAMKHCESLMMRGWLIPERSATEAQKAGSRADSETAADWAMVAADLTLHDITQSVNCQIVDPLLVLNFGDKAKGTVRIKRAGLSAPLQAFFRALITVTIGNPQQMAVLLKLVDLNALVSAAGLPMPKDLATPEELETVVAESKPQPMAGGEPDADEEDKPLSMTEVMKEVFAASRDEGFDAQRDGWEGQS